MQRRQRERGYHLFALRPVVVRVTFETARLRMIRSGRVALLACRDSRNQNVARFGARQRFFMASRAGKARMCVMIEF